MTDQDTTHSARRGPGRPPEDTARLQFRVSGSMARWLSSRAELSLSGGAGGESLQAKADLTLLRDILEAELRGIRLTLDQARCLADVLNGSILEPFIGLPFGLVYSGAYEEFEHARGGPVRGLSSYGAKHGHEDDWEQWEDALLGYLRSLTPGQDYALRWAIARWWKDGRDVTDAERFAAAGLRLVDG
jgi:hypothetical protein